jgi:tetratricopeptide (TPR) repeat protein
MAEEEPNLYGALVAWFIAEDRMAQAQRVAEAALELPTLRQSERQRLDLALARIALRTDEHEAARTYFEDVLQVSPDHVEANFQLLALDAADAEKGGDLSLAIGLYERMVQLAPDQMQSFYRLGRLQLQLGDTSAAVSAFQNCISNGYRRAELVTLVQSLTDQ